MAKRISCSSCGAAITIPGSHPGGQVFCNTCGAANAVPENAQEVQDTSPPPQQPVHPAATLPLMRPYDLVVSEMVRDMRFMGIIHIVSGAINCLTIIGLVFGIPMLIAGLRLREAADSFEAYGRVPDQGFLARAFERQQRHFYIYKILTIVGIVFTVLYMIVMFGLFVAGALS